jgi:hypothetical protein
MNSLQRVAKLWYRLGIRQHRTHIRECASDADATQARTAKRSNGGGAALGRHVVNQHNPAILAQRLDSAHGVEQHEVKMVVDARLVDEADIELLRRLGTGLEALTVDADQWPPIGCLGCP